MRGTIDGDHAGLVGHGQLLLGDGVERRHRGEVGRREPLSDDHLEAENRGQQTGRIGARGLQSGGIEIGIGA